MNIRLSNSVERQYKIFPVGNFTLMEDPEERLDEEILNGVALRPRVKSENNTEKAKICLDMTHKNFYPKVLLDFLHSYRMNKSQRQRPRKILAPTWRCTVTMCSLLCTVLVLAISHLHKLP